MEKSLKTENKIQNEKCYVYSKEQASKIRCEFSRLKDLCYLDHAGATLYSEKQLANIFTDLSNNIYSNPHSHSSEFTKDAVDIVRYKVLSFVKTSPDQYSVIFTSGATHALKLIGETFEFNGGTLAYLEDNHTSVLGMRKFASNFRELKVEEAFNVLSNPADSNSELRNGKNGLFVYPAQSNFAGTKYPLSWIKTVKCEALNHLFATPENWYTLLDAACFASTNQLDLHQYQPDFISISFYKIFGYPTGLGALLVKRSSENALTKTYFGGGTVLMALSAQNVMIPKPIIYEQFEDGTISFLSISSLRHGFDILQTLNLTPDLISLHTFNVAKYTFANLMEMHHSNGTAVAELYHDTKFESVKTQGSIINFNLKRPNGNHVGYSEVLHFANLNGVHLRTGCFCNPGACQKYLKLDPDKVQNQFEEITGKLVNIYVYPVKSCAPLAVKGSWKLTHIGLEYDRRWMIVNSSGACVSQKKIGKLCTLKPILDFSRKMLKLKINDSEISMPLEPEENASSNANFCNSKVCGDKVQGFDCGNEVAEWLSANLGEFGLRLLRQCDFTAHTSGRHSTQGEQTLMSLANKAEYLVINMRTAQWLRERIPQDDLLCLTLESILLRFRANFVVDFTEPFVENDLAILLFNDVAFKFTGHCRRCQMICIDQETGEKSKEPLRTLSKELNGQMRFGIYLSRNDSLGQYYIETGSSVKGLFQSS
ncbi:molybdenum cofactor sulfurase-like [Dendroctonus ponderosae]|uniref:molybdenum cofactor sulfurase-like n=1 Tax=Dendroctonus ponderosae TaxID=77166 RepID=UPI002035199F|nr:molybdenum cofactor sulfurase-like [Dendroctonus ponderosae]